LGGWKPVNTKAVAERERRASPAKTQWA
jgi:hypothetical protein